MSDSVVVIRCDEILNNELEKRLNSNECFAVLYCDIDNLRFYNEIYGFEEGDRAITILSDIIVDSVKSCGDNNDFIAHISGDDFIIITASEKDEEISRKILEEFDKRIPALYNSMDRDRGYIVSKSRLGEINACPIMTISIAVVSNEKRSFSCIPEIMTVLTEVKSKAKAIQKSIYVKDKRVEKTQYIQ